MTQAEELAVASGDSEQVEETLHNIEKAAGDFPNDGRFQKLLDETRKVKKNFQLRDKTYADLTAEEKQAAASGDATQVVRLLNELQMPLQVFPDDRRFQKLLDETRKVAGDLRDKTYADLAAEEKRAAASGDARQVEKSLQSIQKAARDSPDDGRFQKLLDETRKVASDLRLRDKAYADLTAGEKQAAASGDAAQVEKSLQSIQEAAGDFPDDGRFQKLLGETRKVASDLQLRDKTYADLVAAGKQAAASGDAAQVAKSVQGFQKAVGDFPNDSRFPKLLDEARKVAGDLQLRDKTYADLATAEKQAAASGDAAQLEKSVQGLEKAVGDFPNDGRFQKLLYEARKVAGDLQLRDKTYADLATAEKQAATSGDAAQFEKSVQGIQRAVADFPGDDRFQKILDDALRDASEKRDSTYASLVDAEKQAAASGDAAQVEQSVQGLQKAVGDFPNDGRFQKLLDEARKVEGDLQLRDKTYADLAAAEKQAAASGDAAQVEKSIQGLQKVVGDFPGDGRFQKLLDDARKVEGDLQLRDKTYVDLAAAEKQAVVSGDAAQVEKSIQGLQKVVGDFPGDGRFQKLLEDARKVEGDLQLRDRTYVDLAAAEKQAVVSGDAAQVENSVQGLQKAVGDFPRDGRFQKLLEDARKDVSDLQKRDSTYASLLDAEKRAVVSGDAAEFEKSVRSIYKAVGDFPGDGRFQKLLDDARKDVSDLEKRDSTYASLLDAEKRAVASGDAAEFEKSVRSLYKAVGDFPGDGRFQKLLDAARKDVSDLEMRDSTYANLLDAEKRAVVSGDASQVAKNVQSIQKAVGDFPGDGRFQKLLDDARKDASDLQGRTQTKPAATAPPSVPSRPHARSAPPAAPPPPERVVRAKPQPKAAPRNNCFSIAGQRYCE